MPGAVLHEEKSERGRASSRGALISEGDEGCAGGRGKMNSVLTVAAGLYRSRQSAMTFASVRTLKGARSATASAVCGHESVSQKYLKPSLTPPAREPRG